ncbi:hypothetical protein CEXT_734581 [Caerostris extrusa]|uniref:Uncharacterized protein n=1 Tax=Caerostris extrusa TaxID=172846 RepID=A0AAV4V1K5_CAEEX|nr:hypothetical protein CEXT_734581 [Caerostris extrusa]
MNIQLHNVNKCRFGGKALYQWNDELQVMGGLRSLSVYSPPRLKISSQMGSGFEVEHVCHLLIGRAYSRQPERPRKSSFPSSSATHNLECNLMANQLERRGSITLFMSVQNAGIINPSSPSGRQFNYGNDPPPQQRELSPPVRNLHSEMFP